MSLGIWGPARPPKVCILKELQSGKGVSALTLQPISFVWQKNIYKNIIKYISYILLSPVLLSTFLKFTHPNSDKPKQEMTIHNRKWQSRQLLIGPCSCLRAEMTKQKAEEKKVCYQLLIYKSQKPLGERPWVICCSVAKSCLTLCDLMDCSMLGSSVLHCLSEFAQIHVHWVGDAI